jgi:hypothetical protein
MDPEGLARHAGWVQREVSPRYFPAGGVAYANFAAVRRDLKKLGLLEEAPAVQFWSPDFGVTKRWCTRFRAMPPLKLLAAQHGVQPAEADKHFIVDIRNISLPKQTLRRMTASTYRSDGQPMKIDYTDPKVKALAEVISGLNHFLDQFVIEGGIHRGYVRQFEIGDHARLGNPDNAEQDITVVVPHLGNPGNAEQLREP